MLKAFSEYDAPIIAALLLSVVSLSGCQSHARRSELALLDSINALQVGDSRVMVENILAFHKIENLNGGIGNSWSEHVVYPAFNRQSLIILYERSNGDPESEWIVAQVCYGSFLLTERGRSFVPGD